MGVHDGCEYAAGNTTLTLKGEMFDGTPFEGADSVNIVP